MRKSLNTGTFRKRAGIAAAGLAVAAAVAVPGVAWATDSVPQGGPVVVQESGPAVLGGPLDAATCAGMAIELSPETLQKMIADGTAVPATPVTPATPTVPAGEAGLAHTKVLTEDEVQRMIADGTIVRAVAPAVLPAGAVQMLSIDEAEGGPAGAITVTRAC